VIATLLVIVAALVLPTILVLGALFVLGSAVAAIVDGATSGLVRSEVGEPA
jgi:hypothetical protein